MFHGLWQAPDGSCETHGYLEILSHGLRLKMIGIRDTPPAATGEAAPSFRMLDPLGDHPDIPVLCARTAEGKHVSLFDLQFMHSKGDWFGTEREHAYYEYQPRLALIGGRQVPDLGAERFSRITLDLQHFSNWAPGLPLGYEFRDDQPTRHYLMLEQAPLVTEVRVETARLTLEFRTYVTSKPLGGRETFDRHGSVTLRPDDPQDMPTLLSRVGQVHTLLNFLFGQRLRMKRLTVATPHVSRTLNDGTVLFETFELVTNRGRPQDLVDDRLAPVFPFAALGEQAAGVFGDWLNADLQLRRAVSAFVMVAFKQDLVLDSKFTDLAGILESMARGGERQTYMDRAAFKRLARQIRAGIPEDLPEALRTILAVRINTANEYSLQSKAQGLIEACWPVLEGRVTLTPAEFAEALANNRNALVHNDEGRKRLLVRDEVALYFLTEAITVVAYAAVALRLGIDRNAVLANVKRTLDRHTWRLGAEQFRTGGEPNG